jgi:DNA-binding IclR family transcriptional regulator
MQPVTVNVRVGSVMPVLWSATGRAFGAFSKAAVLQPLIQTELASASPENRKTHRRRSCPPPQIK